jgi:hypothetical protein
MRTLILAFSFIVVSAMTAFGQDSTTVRSKTPPSLIEKFSWENVMIGGNLGFTRYYLNISPSIGYKLTDKLVAGIGSTYISLGNPYNPQRITIYGGKVFSRYYIFPFAFAHAEVEELNGPWEVNINESFWINTTLVGGGYHQSLGGNSGIDLMLLWNLNESMYSPYSNPIIRMGFNVGL